MIDKIKVGEYVRTKKGEICKVLGVRQEQRVDKRVYSHLAYYLDNYKGSLTPAFIVKHSSNIIDLIEVGDIVRVLDNGYNRKIDLRDEDILQSFKEDLVLENWKLKSIVTKEQFKKMEYRV